MTKEHNITPPQELVYEWARNWAQLGEPTRLPEFIATRAAQWGSDQELEACCEFLQQEGWGPTWVSRLRAARRPKPPSLKQQALDALDHILNNSSTELGASTIRRALEALPDD